MRAQRLILAALVATTALPVSAETLREAMASAYSTNPDITAARAGQRLTDEELVRAKEEVLPSLGASSFVDQETTGPGKFDDLQRQFITGVELRQPVYTFGRARAGMKAADRGVLAGRERLRGTENQLMLDVVTVYMNVLRDQSEVELTTNNVSVLERQLQASTDRFEVGDVTRTDVAQSEARLALARSQNIAAQANLESSRYAYERVVGHPPVDLQSPPPLPPLPQDPDEAVDIALNLNPFVQSARLTEQAQRFRVNQARGQLLPTLDASLRAGYNNIRGLNQQFGIPVVLSDWTQNIRLTATFPLFSKGQLGSQVRSAVARADQARENAIGTERDTVSQVRSAYENVLAARATINAANIAVSANELALEGTRAELTVGTRNILDVLNAEQELLNAQVQLVRAERNSYVAGFALLAAMGQAEVDVLEVPVIEYDPEIYLDRADDHWFDWTAEFTPQSLRATPLIDVPAPTVSGTLPDPTPQDPDNDEVLSTDGHGDMTYEHDD